MLGKLHTHRKIEMTEGSLWTNLFFYSIPLMCSQILEVLFNLSDVAVVGKFSSYTALGAVGSTSILVTLFIGFLIGMGTGVTVRVAHKLGRQDEEGTRRTVTSSFYVCLVTGILIGTSCFVLASPLLRLLKTKDELMQQAVLYLHIYAIGLPGMALYNFGNGVLSARGETKRPLMYLTFAGIVNVILNLFFVIVCRRAADGVAIASAIAQYISAFLVMYHLLHREDACRLKCSTSYVDKEISLSILSIGIPAGVQNAIFAIANLFVQASVNSFDAIMVSGNSAAQNADTLIFNLMAAFYTGCSSFISCNYGAGKKDRMLKSYFIALFYSFMAGFICGALLFLFGRQFLSIFTSEKSVIDAGMERLRIMAFSYMLSAFMDCTIGASRGIGKSIAPMIIVILGSCVFRVVWVYTVFAHFHTIASLYSLYAFSWSITGIAEILCFAWNYKKVTRDMVIVKG